MRPCLDMSRYVKICSVCPGEAAALGLLLSSDNLLEANYVLQIHLTSCGAFGP
jgi:hypothetical protein